MRLTVILMTAAFLNVSAAGISQSVTLSARGVSLEKIFLAAEQQTGYNFFYEASVLKGLKPVNVRAEKVPLEEFLAALLKDKPLRFLIEGRNVIISPGGMATGNKGGTEDAPLPDPILVYGTVSDSSGAPLEGATITVKGTSTRSRSDQYGRFRILAEVGQVLVVSYVGHVSAEITVSAGARPVIRLLPTHSKLNEVVISTGMLTRNKETFTGATSTYSGEQLKAVGNANIIQSLKTLEPSFIVVENNLRGSDPNRLPDIEIRGKTSISTVGLNDEYSANPNQPLFILDGFETTLQTVFELDINRVASITILKDAASTAMYGSKAANGVVVVETLRPVAGELRVSYSGDFAFSIPDLSSYNLMNASEKLQFEKLAGIYEDAQFQWEADERYNRRMATVASGVNTYWLSEPVRTGFTGRHSVQLSGGNRELLFRAGASYRNEAGVMKGSKRQTWGGNFDLTYRKGRVNVSNQLFLNGSTGDASPYGSFTAFAMANPYYVKRAADGSIPKYLDPLNSAMINPLYIATLNNMSQTKGFNVNNNLSAIIDLSRGFRIQAGLQVGRQESNAVSFLAPENPSFDNVDIYQKGSYSNNEMKGFSYDGNLMLSYAKVIEKHQLNVNTRGNFRGAQTNSVAFSAVGFPYGTNGNPSFAYSYTPYSAPSASRMRSRSAGFMASLNYAYDMRFLFDFTYRLDGSSVFGSNRMYKPFSSAGIGWNLHREPMLSHLSWLSLLKLRANVGLTGNENLGQFTSTSVYGFQNGINRFGQGLDLSSLGNPDLEWQSTVQSSYGIDFTLLKNRVSGYVEYYRKRTDPLVISGTALPTSSGVGGSYLINAGNLTTKGWTANLRVSPVYDLKQRIIWTIGVTAATYHSTYGGLGDRLSAMNKAETENRSLVRYSDGFSPDDMWAVVSRGIDPASGREIFQRPDGTLTYSYSTADIVKVGNTRPKAEGVITTNFTYKSITVGANLRYRLSGYTFNSALFGKVENITLQNQAYNQDKRALYERWQKIGDVTQFRAIKNGSQYSATPMSSRFIQEDTHFVGESFNASWRPFGSKWLKKAGLASFSLNFYLNDIFRLETIRTERGIDYPFARSASFSVNASF